jgi:hypothetical protein
MEHFGFVVLRIELEQCPIHQQRHSPYSPETLLSSITPC